METLMVRMAGAAAEHGPTFLGEDLPAWRAAAILAVVAAIGLEILAALTRKVTLRLPFLVLYLAWFSTPKAEWKFLYRIWRAELWDTLKNRDKSFFSRFFKGMAYVIPLALGAARATAKVKDEAAPRRRLASIKSLSAGPGGVSALATVIGYAVAAMSSVFGVPLPYATFVVAAGVLFGFAHSLMDEHRTKRREEEARKRRPPEDSDH
ncbi:hypothetical protein [Streptomyces sp. NPDC047070]|uniref:hypothetical protein n=1 Tax=Streptomyces sp. NPDC047070 TaxID=3154923 RepID=UPI0034548992